MASGETGDAQIEVLFPPEAIAERIDALAAQIAAAALEDLMVVSVLTGSFVFAADLLRGLYRAGLRPQVDFVSLSSYGNSQTTSARINVLRDVALDVAGRNVLLVDDILDTGHTLAFARDLIGARKPRKVLTCVLLDKRERRTVEIEADFVAFQCPPVFVVGYGMDLAHRYRELPYVGRVVDL